MTNDQLFKWLIIANELAALMFLPSIFRSKQSMLFKVAYSLIIFIPFLGIFFYLILSSSAEVQRISFQNRSSSHSNLWGWGRYSEEWQYRKKAMQEKIDKLKKEIEDQEKDKNDR